jgi:hypothetical protein
MEKVCRYVLLPLDWWLFKFHAISLSFDSHQRRSNFHVIYNGSISLSFEIFDLMLSDWVSFLAYPNLTVVDRLSNDNGCCCCSNDFNLTVFDRLSNDNEIAWNLNDHQSKRRITYL